MAAQHDATTTPATTTTPSPLQPHQVDCTGSPTPTPPPTATSLAAAEAVSAAAAAAGLRCPPAAGAQPALPYDPVRAQAVADEVTAGVLARLASAGAGAGAGLAGGGGHGKKWVCVCSIWEAGSGAGVHVGAALLGGEAAQACYGVGGDGMEGVVSVFGVSCVSGDEMK